VIGALKADDVGTAGVDLSKLQGRFDGVGSSWPTKMYAHIVSNIIGQHRKLSIPKPITHW
jgi:hypothetical protein